MRVAKLVAVLAQQAPQPYGRNLLAVWEHIAADTRRARLFDLHRREVANDTTA